MANDPRERAVPSAPGMPALPPPSPGLFRFREAPADDVSALSDALHAIYREELDVLIVRGVYSREAMAEVVARLERSDVPLPRTPQESADETRSQMFILGDIITPSDTKPEGPPIERYLDHAAQYLDGIGQVFAGHADFHARLHDLFGRMGGGRSIHTPVHPSGRSFTPTTARLLPPDCLIPLHVGNYFLSMPAYQFLTPVIDTRDQLSFFMVMAQPDAGGELSVFKLKFDDPQVPLKNGYVDEPQVITGIAHERFQPGPGDLLVFDGGRYFHRVERVGGARARWTIGGFLCFGKDGRSIYFWS